MEPQRFEILKIFVDKLLIGLLLAGGVFFADRELEKHKDYLQRNKLIHDKKFEMLVSLVRSYKDLTYCMVDDMSIRRVNAAHFDHHTCLIKFQREVVKITPFISRETSEMLERYLWIYSTNPRKLYNPSDFILFFEFLEDEFDRALRTELRYDVGKEPENHSGFHLVECKESEVESPRQYLRLNYNKWLKWKEKNESSASRGIPSSPQ